MIDVQLSQLNTSAKADSSTPSLVFNMYIIKTTQLEKTGLEFDLSHQNDVNII